MEPKLALGKRADQMFVQPCRAVSMIASTLRRDQCRVDVKVADASRVWGVGVCLEMLVHPCGWVTCPREPPRRTAMDGRCRSVDAIHQRHSLKLVAVTTLSAKALQHLTDNAGAGYRCTYHAGYIKLWRAPRRVVMARSRCGSRTRSLQISGADLQECG